MQALPGLVDQAPDSQAVASELCISLLHASNAFDIPDFSTLRKNALVTLCETCTIPTATALTSQFYTQNVSLEARLLILEVISDTAICMSNLNTQSVIPPPATPLGLSDHNKTRRWTLSSHIRAHTPKPRPNRFGIVLILSPKWLQDQSQACSSSH